MSYIISLLVKSCFCCYYFIAECSFDSHVLSSGPIGHDIGLALSFPIGCMIAHGMKGQWEADQSIEVYINSLLDTYRSRMVEAGKTTEDMAKILRSIVGTCGMFMYFYIMGVHDTFPVDAKNKSRHHHALGVLGLKFVQLSNNMITFWILLDLLRSVGSSTLCKKRRLMILSNCLL